MMILANIFPLLVMLTFTCTFIVTTTTSSDSILRSASDPSKEGRPKNLIFIFYHKKFVCCFLIFDSEAPTVPDASCIKQLSELPREVLLSTLNGKGSQEVCALAKKCIDELTDVVTKLNTDNPMNQLIQQTINFFNAQFEKLCPVPPVDL